MSKYKRLLLPALLAAGAMLLTACDLGSSADDGKQNTPTTANSTPEDVNAEEGAEDEGDQLGYTASPPEGGCGEYASGDGPYSKLIPDEGSLGFISCDEAMSVLGDFDLLDAQVEIPAEGLTFNDDWHCDTTVDAGVTVRVECFTPAIPDPANPILVRFHTEPV
jgi:hypothetical protein